MPERVDCFTIATVSNFTNVKLHKQHEKLTDSCDNPNGTTSDKNSFAASTKLYIITRPSRASKIIYHYTSISSIRISLEPFLIESSFMESIRNRKQHEKMYKTIHTYQKEYIDIVYSIACFSNK